METQLQNSHKKRLGKNFNRAGEKNIVCSFLFST